MFREIRLVAWIAVLALALVALASGVALAGSITGRTDILISGVGPPTGSGYELQAGGRAYVVGHSGGGAISVVGDHPFRVRVFALANCDLLLSFTADPDHAYEIDYHGDGHLTMHETLGTDGPGLLPHQPAACKKLPDTSLGNARDSGNVPMFLMAAAVGAWLGRGLRRRLLRPAQDDC